MQKKILTLSIFISTFIPVFSQSPELNWIQGIGEGATYININKVTLDAENNYYVLGKYFGTADMDPGPGVAPQSTGIMDIFVGKYDSSGNYLWAYTFYAIGSSDDPRYIETDAQNNVYVVGSVSVAADINPGPDALNIPAGSGCAFVTKLNPDGDFVWAYALENIGTFDYNDMTGFDVTSAGVAYFSGTYSGDVDFDFTTGTNQLPTGFAGFFGKLNSDGTLDWVHQHAQTNYLNSLVINEQENGLYLTANFPPSGAIDIEPNAGVENVNFIENVNAVITHTDLDGNYISHFSFGCDNANGLEVKKVEINNGDLFVYGIFTGTLDLDPTAGVNSLVSMSGAGVDQDVFIAKYDNGNNLAWAKHLTGNNYIDDGSMTTDVYGNSYFSGLGYGNTDTDPGSSTDIKGAGLYILKLDQNGDRVWIYHDPTQYATSSALIYNKYEHSLIGTGFCSPSVDFDPEAGIYNIPFGGSYLLNWNNCNSVSYETTLSYSAGNLVAVDTLADDTFQWFDCNTTLPILGADSSVFDPLLAGSYQVQIANEYGACSSLSDCIIFSDASIDSNLPIEIMEFRVYPNPTSTEIVVVTNTDEACQYKILNASGEIVFETLDESGNLIIDVKNFTSGVYFMGAITANGISRATFIKN